MIPHITILVADRNPHVREFLKRELSAEGYDVLAAENGKQVLRWAYSVEDIDLLILDPDLPDVGEKRLLHKLQGRIPCLSTVIHGFPSEQTDYMDLLNVVAFVEKGGQSVEQLKNVIQTILNVPPPARLSTSPASLAHMPPNS